MNAAKRFILALSFSGLGLGLIPGLAFAESMRGRISRPSAVHVDPNPRSQILGRYQIGNSVMVEGPEDGWYKVFFSRPWKGHDSAWVRADSVQIAAQPAGRRSNSSPSGRSGSRREPRLEYWLGLGAGLLSVSPADFQQAIGESARTVGSMGFGLELGQRLGRSSSLALGLGKLSFSDKLLASGASGSYDLSLLYTSFLYAQTLFSTPGFMVAVTAGPGVVRAAVTHTTLEKAIVTENMMTFFLSAGISAKKSLFGYRFGIEGNATYTSLSISDVPGLYGGQRVSANLSLSGLKFGGGLFYRF